MLLCGNMYFINLAKRLTEIYIRLHSLPHLNFQVNLAIGITGPFEQRSSFAGSSLIYGEERQLRRERGNVLSFERLKTALVTGAARRIGASICQDLARNGFAVAIHANGSIEDAEKLAADLRQEGHAAAAIRADLAETAEASTLVEKAAEALGRPVGLLVNNASVFRNDSGQQFDPETFDTHFAIHVRAPSILSAAFFRQLPAEAEGLIVNIIDQRVWALNPRFHSYTLSKAALWTATQTLAQSFAPRVRVNAIGPGPTFKSERQDGDAFKRQTEGLLLKRGPEPQEFGRTIRFLFDTPSITGQMIALDGGQHLAWETPDVAEIME